MVRGKDRRGEGEEKEGGRLIVDGGKSTARA